MHCFVPVGISKCRRLSLLLFHNRYCFCRSWFCQFENVSVPFCDWEFFLQFWHLSFFFSSFFSSCSSNTSILIFFIHLRYFFLSSEWLIDVFVIKLKVFVTRSTKNTDNWRTVFLCLCACLKPWIYNLYAEHFCLKYVGNMTVTSLENCKSLCVWWRRKVTVSQCFGEQFHYEQRPPYCYLAVVYLLILFIEEPIGGFCPCIILWIHVCSNIFLPLVVNGKCFLEMN